MNGYENLPAHWDLVRLKRVVIVRHEKGTYRDKTEDKYIGLENIRGYSEKLVDTDTEYDTSIQSICRKGDLLFGKLRPYLSKVIIAPYDAFCTGELLVISYFKGDMRYLRYVMLNPEFISEVDSSTYGAKMPRASSAFILNVQIPLPPIEEQEQIAHFLDWKISGIDRLIAIRKDELTNLEELKKALITREVTRGNWECVKLKRVARINPQCDSHGLKSEDIVTFAPMECIRTDRRIPKDAPLSSDNSSYTAFNNGDIAIAKVTPCFENDNICIMENLTNGYAFGSSELFNVRPFNIDTKFLLYYLMSHDFKSGGVANMTGAIGLKRVPSKYLRNALVPCPPMSEQKRIADYLDRKCTQIDSAITNFTAQIDTLKELKACLISDTVTGKMMCEISQSQSRRKYHDRP